ncbi:MAG: FAD-dependent monooxygenase [Alphaproteobacteria bacterium]|nr:FAD-dependent monooxygenase [Alphaproteobacteria bacterium]
MRPAGKGALESLYFHYPTFAARRVAELDGRRDRHPVAIAGAGPIGMTAALVLAQYGISSTLLDRKETFIDGSRAVCIARPSMQILQRIGAVEPLPSKALSRWRNA